MKLDMNAKFSDVADKVTVQDVRGFTNRESASCVALFSDMGRDGRSTRQSGSADPLAKPTPEWRRCKFQEAQFVNRQGAGVTAVGLFFCRL